LVLNDASSDYKAAVPFTRLWCMFEGYFSIHNKGTLLDIATVCRGTVEIITEGLTDYEKKLNETATEMVKVGTRLQHYDHSVEVSNLVDDIKMTTVGEEHKAAREKSFPTHLIAEGLRVELQSASASVEEDEIHILNSIAGLPLDGVPPKAHDNYDSTNLQLRSRFAEAALRQAYDNGLVESMELPRVLSEDPFRKQLTLSFKGCYLMQDHELVSVAKCCSSFLEEVSLCFDSCKRISSAGIAFLTSRLPKSILKLRLQLRFCHGLDDGGLAAIAAHLPASVQMLELRLQKCGSIGNAGIAALGAGIGKRPTLKSLQFGVGWCTGIGNTGLAAFAEGLKLLPDLQILHLYFQGTCIGNDGVAFLGERLPTSLRCVDIRLNRTMVTHPVVSAFSRHTGEVSGMIPVGAEGDEAAAAESAPEKHWWLDVFADLRHNAKPVEPAEPAVPTEPKSEDELITSASCRLSCDCAVL